MYKLRIKEAISERGITIEEFAKLCNVRVVTAYRYMNVPNITLNKLQEIADAIGCRIKDLFVEDGEDAVEGDFGVLSKDVRSKNLRRRTLRLLDNLLDDINDIRDEAMELVNSDDEARFSSEKK